MGFINVPWFRGRNDCTKNKTAITVVLLFFWAEGATIWMNQKCLCLNLNK
jgi:hypothetical protein